MDEIIQLITQVGFPIAACVAVWLDGRKREDKLLAQLEKSTDAMTRTASALDRLSDAINSREV
jgi:hypothetical protein